jgi:hypothetical protein
MTFSTFRFCCAVAIASLLKDISGETTRMSKVPFASILMASRLAWWSCRPRPTLLPQLVDLNPEVAIRQLDKSEPMREIARSYNVNHSTISRLETALTR